MDLAHAEHLLKDLVVRQLQVRKPEMVIFAADLLHRLDSCMQAAQLTSLAVQMVPAEEKANVEAALHRTTVQTAHMPAIVLSPPPSLPTSSAYGCPELRCDLQTRVLMKLRVFSAASQSGSRCVQSACLAPSKGTGPVVVKP